MKLPLLRICLAGVFLASVFAIGARAQASSDTRSAIDGYSAAYTVAVGDNMALFVGEIQGPLEGGSESLYLRERGSGESVAAGRQEAPRPVGTPDSYSTGDLLYDGVKYVGVRMRLDLYRDEFSVTAPGSSYFGTIIDPDRFGFADLRGYRVVRIPPNRSDLSEGYYLRLNEFGPEVLKKESYEYNPIYREFSGPAIRYYVERNGVYHKVSRSKGSVLRLLRDERGGLDDFIRSRGINLRRDTDNALVLIAGEYERLRQMRLMP
ncbi:MAG: hypothetical protein LBV38_06500 [Alistipes sp.]|jgi:hypothetical protein|nr:hypothetical protein [Alistipes sp.]